MSIPSMKSGTSQTSLIKKPLSGRKTDPEKGQDNHSYQPDNSERSESRRKENRRNSASQMNGAHSLERSSDKASGVTSDNKLANEILKSLSESRAQPDNQLANEVLKRLSESRGQTDSKSANEVTRKMSESRGQVDKKLANEVIKRLSESRAQSDKSANENSRESSPSRSQNTAANGSAGHAESGT